MLPGIIAEMAVRAGLRSRVGQKTLHHNPSVQGAKPVANSRIDAQDWDTLGLATASRCSSFPSSKWFGSLQANIVLLLLVCLPQMASGVPPYVAKWQDRRIIAQDVMAGGTTPASSTNPRGWFQSPSRDYVSTAGMARLRTDLLARADAEIALLTNIPCQGIVLWSLEGCEIPDISYVGDPRKLSLLAPEMDAVADDYFAKFRAAGLRVGVTVRPTTFGAGTVLPPGTNGQVFIKTDAPVNYKEYYNSNGVWLQQTNHNQQNIATSFYYDFLDKIRYARSRWGCTLFYIDSYTSGSSIDTPYKDAALSGILTNYPDILLMPEFSTMNATNWFSAGAPVLTPHVTGYFVPTNALNNYPKAFGVVRVGGVDSDPGQILASVEAHNIMMFGINGGFTNKIVPVIVSAYDTAYLPAPTGFHVVEFAPQSVGVPHVTRETLRPTVVK